MKHGRGCEQIDGKINYIGQFQLGRKNGKGVFIDIEKNIFYDGEWIEGF